jgi:hypothetical protein
MINADFVSHFNDLAVSINSEVIKYFVEFMGFSNSPYNIINVYLYNNHLETSKR